MRRSSRQLVAAWLLALPLGRGGEECARRGRLEMISFWLLCWKLLRATAGLRRTTLELTAGDQSTHPDSSLPSDSAAPPTSEDPVSMETASSPDLERDNLFGCSSRETEEHNYPGVYEVDEESSEERNVDGDECDYLVFETGEKEQREEEDKSDISDETGNEGRTETGGEKTRWGEGKEDEEREIEENEKDSMEIKGVDDGDVDEDLFGTEEDERRSGTKEGNGWMTETQEDITQNALPNLLIDSENPSCLLPEALVVTTDPPETTWLEPWEHEPTSRDDLGECFQSELAVTYSDCDDEEDHCGVTSQEGYGAITDDAEKMKEETAEDEVEVETGAMEQKELEKKKTQEVTEEQMISSREESLRSPSVSSTTSSTDPDRKVPPDFCVEQEPLNENISTEHVDFMLARKQWQKMEEEVKGQPIPKPGLRAHGSFQGTHSSLYPPTRSPRLKHKEIQPPVAREPPLSSTLSPSSEDSGLDDSSYRSPQEESESAVDREIRLTLEREERHRKERGMIAQGLTLPRPSTLQTGRSPPRPPACRTPTLSISPTPSCSSALPRSAYHEMTANNVIILEPDSSNQASRNRLICDWPASLDVGPSANVIVVETSNLIIRSASEFSLSTAPISVETQESTFLSNPFFKLRSISSQSLVEQEIKMVKQREDEWRRQREEMWRRKREEEWRRGREKYDTVLVSPGLNDSISISVPDVADRSVSSPSSPCRARKMERSSLSCDHKFPPSFTSVSPRQNAMAQRWEASLLASQKKK
ncbi:cyclic nucleotide-gated cation channel beta-1 isoform X1 [Oryzias melastigma]|uniref:cyclic nucleotide-gated cation channel beta-1 isoform X1 n=2 Tax=Oryzias melastigma TaxID=30732 RepID=UPI00168D31B5|nr:cyclic nucleotide-gated cation channel beta-1 isoform X1 [Oryzias melastigma]